MSNDRDRVAGRGLYGEKFYDSLREVKRLLDRHESEDSKSGSSISQSSRSMNNGSGSQPNDNAPGQPARPQPAQPEIWPPPRPRPLAAGNASQSTASNVVNLRPALELFIDPSWQFEWDGTYYYCNWPGCHRVFEATEITSRHRATHDRYRYMAGEIPLPSYPQPEQDHAASTTGGQQISLPLR